MKGFLRLTILVPFFILSTPAHAATTPAFEIQGWIPWWRQATGTIDVLPHLNQLTTINPFTLRVTTNGTLTDLGPLTQDPWTTFMAQAKAKKVRVIPTILWGNGDQMHRILSNTTTRIALEDEIAAAAKKNNWDGIDIDFEAKKAETINYFSTFLKGLYQRMGTKWVYCTIEARMPLDSRYNGTPPADATKYANDYTQLNKYCDRIIIMAYDQGSIDVKLNAARAAPYVPVADPAWSEKVILLAAKSFPKKKIILGIPTYGYEYSVTPLSEYGYRYDVQWALNPKYAWDTAAQYGVQPVRNAAGELSFIYKPSTTTPPVPASTSSLQDVGLSPAVTLYSQASIAAQIAPPFNIVWWSDASAVKDKVDLAHRLGIRGVAVFKFDGGEDPGIWNILK